MLHDRQAFKADLKRARARVELADLEVVPPERKRKRTMPPTIQSAKRLCALEESDDDEWSSRHADLSPSSQNPTEVSTEALDSPSPSLSISMFSSRSPSLSFSLSEPESTSAHDVCPSGIYTIDMVRGIKRMHSAKYKALYSRQQDRFEAVFKCQHKKGTWNEAHRRWKMGKPGLIQTLAGRRMACG
jgi:hypothetical protein